MRLVFKARRSLFGITESWKCVVLDIRVYAASKGLPKFSTPSARMLIPHRPTLFEQLALDRSAVAELTKSGPADILRGDFWPEPVRVLTVQALGQRMKIEAVGLQTQQFFSQILAPEDMGRVRVATETARDFGGRSEPFFLAVEGFRVPYAYQFDPLYAVNVSQVDPLPHQIEAVYHYVLRNPRLRFLLADDPGAGKTIMTGLLLKELKYRGLIHRSLVVVPGHLKDQWLREMKERFVETFTVVDRGVMNATWGRNVWQEQSPAGRALAHTAARTRRTSAADAWLQVGCPILSQCLPSPEESLPERRERRVDSTRWLCVAS